MNLIGNKFFADNPSKVLGEFSISDYMNKIIVKGDKGQVENYFNVKFNTQKSNQNKSIDELGSEYESKSVDELIAIKKKLYPSPDIESPMSNDEKFLNKVIAKKFSEINEKIAQKRRLTTINKPVLSLRIKSINKLLESNPNNVVYKMRLKAINKLIKND